MVSRLQHAADQERACRLYQRRTGQTHTVVLTVAHLRPVAVDSALWPPRLQRLLLLVAPSLAP